MHATTLFTNALIERNGARTGLLTTRGFRDTLEIGRERKYELYDLTITKPPPLVPRDRRLEASERIGANGEVLEPLDEDSLDEAMSVLAATGVDAVAIGFLHAYANPEHERRARDRLAERHPGLPVTISSEVAPEIREFERISTTVANACLMPLAERYVERLAERVATHGIGCRLLLMLSSGGLTDADEARRFPVRMLESGPAAGAIAAAWFGARAGHDDLLAFDMGGTTAKLCLVDGGEPLVTHAFEACRERRFIPGSGLPLRISALELIEIGAGGGSIARVDELGLLKVGPESAGSDPGPACYGRGGREPTVTDADLVLGYLDAASFAGGSMPLRQEAADATLASLESGSGLAGFELARGVFDVVTENMVSAARVHIAERGRDPRRYVLHRDRRGRAGPRLVPCRAARHRTRRLPAVRGRRLRPRAPPRTGSGGIGWRRWPSPSRTSTGPGSRRPTGAWRERAARCLRTPGSTPARPRSSVPRTSGSSARTSSSSSSCPRDRMRRRRRLASRTRSGGTTNGSIPGCPRGRYRGGERPNRRPGGRRGAGGGGPPQGRARRREPRGPKGTRPAYFPERDGPVETPVYDRYALRPGDRFPGPAIVEERESTAVVGPAVVRDRRRGKPRDDPSKAGVPGHAEPAAERLRP